MESSALTARSEPTCDSQNTACSRTSGSGSLRADASRISSAPSPPPWEMRNTAFRRRHTDAASRRHNKQLLSKGALYVAKLTGDGLEDGVWDGTGQWILLTTDTVSNVPGMSVADVRAMLRDALDGGLDSTAIADFLALVDWSGTDQRRPPIADLLGQLEAWSTEYAEGDLSRDQYIDRLVALLPERERRTRAAR